MGLIRPATPGFLVTLVATVLLAVVVFCVPYFKSIYFLKATITVDKTSGSITFGTLGYCIEIGPSVSCSKPSIGYQLDINGLVGNKLPVQIPQVVVKWITYLLVLHVVALVGAAGSAVFGLLAHVREMSMACCSTCFSGFAAVVTMLAFIFDMILFFVAKSRINAIGTASIGTAIWLTLAAWVLLFFSGCFFSVGRCCIGKRPNGSRGSKWDKGNWGFNNKSQGPDNDYAEQMRLDAVKAEADRKAKAKQGEVGLPAFYETVPLTGRVEGDQIYLDGDRNDSHTDVNTLHSKPSSAFRGGYAPATPGNRTVDDYYAQPNTYPPQGPRRQPSDQSQFGRAPTASPAPTQATSAYGAGYGQHNIPPTRSPSNGLLAPSGGYHDPYARDYGHNAGGSSYHTASSQHGQDATTYSQYNSGYDAYNQPTPSPQAPYPQPSFNPDVYNQTAQVTRVASPGALTSNPYYNYPAQTTSPPSMHQPQPERNYTLGGGYGNSSVPPLPEHQPYDAYNPTSSESYHPAPIDTSVAGAYGGQPHTSPIRGPRPQPGIEEAPPGYDASPAGVQGNWGKR
ncbi:hypothetical protein CPB83DRAFT_785624 [Crepidotus variabilis]|uniref:Pali-domain-containing protein n=1 Tax=Crepidotus variabilis TaxID=179855 RepID=A0A9P6JSF3_9AGAR|nr:hypothetical protein CPB83DRAFT_785624 [Crepidotus variabilis]